MPMNMKKVVVDNGSQLILVCKDNVSALDVYHT